MRWPHHSWRLTFQSRMFVSQCSQVFSNRSGRIRVRPDAGRLERAGRQRLGPDEPLGLEPRLEDVVAALAAPDDHLVDPLLDRGRRAPVEGGHDPAARLVSVQAVELRAGVRDGRVVGEDRRRGQAVALAGLVVVLVVGRRDLHGARAERAVDDVVGDDRHVAIDERDPHPASDEVAVALVVGMDGHRRVAEDRLGPGRGDRDRSGSGSGSPVASSIRW